MVYVEREWRRERDSSLSSAGGSACKHFLLCQVFVFTGLDKLLNWWTTGLPFDLKFDHEIHLHCDKTNFCGLLGSCETM